MHALLLVASVLPGVPGAAPPAPRADPAALVRQLGSDQFAERVAAERALLALGARAVDAVLTGRASDDLEIRRRCASLAKKIWSGLGARRAKALREGRPDRDLPLWDHYRRMMGSGKVEAALFAEMYEEEVEVFEEVAWALRQRDYHRVKDLHQGQVDRFTEAGAAKNFPGRPSTRARDLPPEDYPRILAALFIGTLPGARLGDEGWSVLTTPLSYHTRFRRNSSRKGPEGEAVRKLLGRWCLTARTDLALWNASWQVLAHGLPGPGRELARRVLAESDNPQTLAGAACVLGHHGTEDDITRLLLLVKNAKEYHTVLRGIQVRDVAVVSLARLTGQNPRDYGASRDTPLFTTEQIFTDAKGSFLALIPCYPVALYRTPTAREAALRKWEEWARKNARRLEPAS
jgi:hypothetical protein